LERKNKNKSLYKTDQIKLIMIKLLGSGSYGCVINKSIKNKPYSFNYVGDVTNKEFKKDESENKHISKIFASTEAYCEELTVITKILFKYHKYFNSIELFKNLSLAPKKCSSFLISSNMNKYNNYEKKHIVMDKLNKFFKQKKNNDNLDSEKKETISECILEKFDNETNNYKIHEIVYDNGGISLDDIEMNDHDFIKSFIILCKSLQTLHELQFIHRDIKPGNILYNNNNNKLSLIDFGMCIPSNEVYTNKQKWWVESEYFVSPPEYCLIDKNNKYKNLDVIYTHFYKNDEFYNKKKKEYDDFFNSYNNINTIEEIPDKIKKVAYKGDIYSLGITLLILFEKNNIKITHSDNNLIKTKFFDLIDNMTNSNPFNRYNLSDVINDLFELEKLYISEVELNAYNDIKCDQDIENVTNTLSNLKQIGGGKIKLKKNKKYKKNIYKKPLKNKLNK
jgi:serine/threonine protein kinase